LNTEEKTAEPMMFQDGVRWKEDGMQGKEVKTSSNDLFKLGDKPWAAHQMELPKESELPALPSINDMKGTFAQRNRALDEMKQQRFLEIRNMRKVFKAAELTVSHQQLMQGDGIVFGQVADADRDNLLLKTPKQTMVTGFVSVPVLEGSRTFKDSLRVRVSVPKGTNGVLVIRVMNMEMQASGVAAGGKPTGGAKKKKQTSKKGMLDMNSIPGMLIFGENREEIITLDADGEKPYEFLIGYDAVVSAQLVDARVYGGLPGSNPGNVVGKSDWATAVYNRKENNYKVSLGEGVVPHPQYSAGGLGALVDEIQGSIEWRAGGWMGFYDQDFSAVIDMGSVKSVSEVSARFLQDSRAWILCPRHFSVMTSTDGVKFTPWAQEVALKDDWQNNETRIDQVTIEHTDGKAGVKPIKARYVKVVADKYGKLPAGHLGYPYNGSGYIFMDEIQIR
jgi:hypothetical protein